MRIVCPGCEAAYEVPEAMLSPGRAVRCARCGRDWVPLPEEERPAATEEPSPEDPPLGDGRAGELQAARDPDEVPEVAPDDAVSARHSEDVPEVPLEAPPKDGDGPVEEPAGDGRQQAAPPEPAQPAMELAAGPATLLDEPLPPPAARERPLREEIVVPPRRLPPIAQPERGPSLILAWTLSILLLLAVVAALLVWQEEIGAAWPPSQWLYRALGLA